LTAPNPTSDPNLADAYAACRAIAKREAKNFYYAFVALPPERRNAICAIYAFMRQADDLADDEVLSREERRLRLDSWLAQWRKAAAGEATSDAAFLAVRDATTRFKIPLTLLDELVAGVTMDLNHAASDQPDTYATFNELYHYCYLVASVVGLVCIRIFGYTDPRAEALAEETGVAFQLTNILRDVKEDAERNRIYIPIDLMDEFGESVPELRELAAGRPMTERERAMLATLAIRAEKYYVAAGKLIPLLDRDSRAAMHVLVAIYHRLLAEIAARKMDVFSARASVSTPAKLAILTRGALMAAWNWVLG
jgi:phytoene synthase